MWTTWGYAYYPITYNMKTYIFQCLLAFILFVPSPAAAWEGIVTNVHDGDTLTVALCGDMSVPVGVRLYGIDAPELRQTYGIEARDALRAMLPVGHAVQVVALGTDRYGRVVGLVMDKGHNVGGRRCQLCTILLIPPKTVNPLSPPLPPASTPLQRGPSFFPWYAH